MNGDSNVKNVLFVCTGNVCRSPMAEALFRSLIANEEGYEVRSAGISAAPGQPASGHTQEVLLQDSISVDGFESSPLSDELANWATHLVAMTRHHIEAIEMLFPEAAERTYLATEFSSDDQVRDGDIPDPIGLGIGAYKATHEALTAALPGLHQFIEQTTSPSSTLDTMSQSTASSEDSATTPKSIAIGADHGGFALKEALIPYLTEKGYEIADMGAHDTESVDYPDFAEAVVSGLLNGESELGILCCTSGIGMSIAANRHPGIQASLVTTTDAAKATREHNNSNVLCLSANDSTPEQVKEIADAWISAGFAGGRHERRVDKMNSTPTTGAALATVDPTVAAIIAAEGARQQNNIELIASENFTSKAVMEAQGSCLTNKYAEGYPGRRWYGGCEEVDKVETLAIERLKEVFGAEFANVQPHSGSQANAAVYFSVLKPGDKILTMDLSHGGHLTHGHQANFSGKFYEVCHYGVTEEDGRIDYDALQKQADEFKPKMITAGASAYPRIIDFERMAKIAKSVDAYLFVDMAHIAGLVAAGVHPSPIPHADFVTSTTHKSLRGPRGGIILTKDEALAKKIDGQVFPGVQGGPLMHVIAAKAVCFGEALKPDFKEYQEQVVKNAAALSARLVEHGYKISSGGTDNHLFLLDVRPQGINGKIAQHALDLAGITVNKNSIPFDTESPFKGGGIRVGTPAVTTRGMKEAEMTQIADLIHRAISDRKDEASLARIRDEVIAINANFPLPA